MRVRVDTGDKSRPPLRAGMSVGVGIDTGHARGLPHFLATLLGGAGRRGRDACEDGGDIYRPGVRARAILATLMQALDTTIANVALPYIQGSVAASRTRSLGADLLHDRRRDHDAADRVPHRELRAEAPLPRPVGGFTGASILCGIAQSLVEIVLFGSCKACLARRWCRSRRRVLR